MMMFVLNIFIADYFNLGGVTYSNNPNEVILEMGNIFTDGLNLVAYCLILLPWIFSTIRKQWYRVSVLILSVVVLIAVMVAGKRISFTGIIFGFVVYLFTTKNKSKVFQVVTVLTLLIVILSPIFIDKLERQLQIRENRLQIDSYEGEARYLETFIVVDEILSFDSPIISIFGKELFNSPFNYGNGIFGDRQLHVDYNVILHGSGIIGFFLYIFSSLFLYGNYLSLRKQVMKYYTNDVAAKYFHPIFISVFWLGFWFALSGGINGVMFQSFRSFVLGGIIGILEARKAQS